MEFLVLDLDEFPSSNTTNSVISLNILGQVVVVFAISWKMFSFHERLLKLHGAISVVHINKQLQPRTQALARVLREDIHWILCYSKSNIYK